MTLSVGIGPSRLVAKTASASFKPAAFVAMSREQAVAHFAGHPVRLLQGVGPKTAERLGGLGLHTVGELQGAPEELLAQRFGERMARELCARAHFHDDTPVEPVRIAKSRSSEVTFPDRRVRSRGARDGARGDGQRARRGPARAGTTRPHDRDQGASGGLDDDHPGAHDRRVHRLRRGDRADRARVAARLRAAAARCGSSACGSRPSRTRPARHPSRAVPCSSRCRCEGPARAQAAPVGRRGYSLAQITVTSPAPSASLVAYVRS